MLQNRILVAGLDKSANNELSKALLENCSGLVQSEHEFQKALDYNSKYGWLNLFIEQESNYRQTLIVLWMNDDTLAKRGKSVTSDEKSRIIDFSNELLFEHYSKKTLNNNGTKVYFVRTGAKTRYQELAEIVLHSIENETVPQFSIENPSNFVWNAPYDVMELIRP